jgi:hypothetical protein
LKVRVSIHQPAYLPWLGYFDKIARSDIFIYLDTVQFQKNSFQNRNKIRVKDGWTWLTVPVLTKGQLFSNPLSKIAINNKTTWRKKHLGAIQMNYRRAPYFEREMEFLGECLEREWEHLSELCYVMCTHFLRRLDIGTRVIKSSELPPMDKAKSGLILDLCREVGANSYLSGALGRNYLETDTFAEAGIALDYQDYEHPRYRQAYGEFEPYMAVIDLLMNEADPAELFKQN